ncbi:glutamate ligase domain-containing protein, partial [Staphylococcus pseudintermedius]|uniref:glutamate ligase domain-containing protein n=1 Tax=Staphylococcus pseudintermedius TaxID=283734 RepID=UPI0036F2D5A9
MAKNVKKAIIAWGDDPYVKNIEVDIPVYYYGFDTSMDVYAQNIEVTGSGTEFDVYVKGEFYGHFVSPQYGDHNILNALAVLTISYLENLNLDNIKEALITFGGVKRRFNETFVQNQVLVDDYAHHPREISATIETARKKYPNKEVVAIFQPHTFSRTKAFLQEFADVLNLADQTYLCDIFGSIRENQGELSINDLLKLVDGAHLIDENSVEQLQKHDNAVLLFMGAGDIQKILKAYMEKIGVEQQF